MTIRTRLTVLLSLLIVCLMVVVLLFVRYRIEVAAMDQAGTDMMHSRESFEGYLRQLDRSFVTHCSLIADLPILKATIDTHDHATVLGAAEEYRKRIGVDAVLVTDGRGILLARTDMPAAAGRDYSSMPFIQTALHHSLWIGASVERHRISRVVTVPVASGDHLWGTFTALSVISDRTARAVKRQTGVDLSFVVGDQVVASSLDSAYRNEAATLIRRLLHGTEEPAPGTPLRANIGSSAWLLTLQPMTQAARPLRLYYVLQESLDRAMRPFNLLQNWLLIVGLISLGVGFGASYWMSGTVTKPVAAMLKAVASIESGCWDHRVTVETDDEFAVLAQSFNNMTVRLRSHLSEQENLRDFLEELLALHEVEPILRNTVETIVRTTPYCGASIYAPAGPGGGIALKASYAEADHADAMCRLRDSASSLVAECFAYNAVVRLENNGGGAATAVPFAAENIVLGVLLLYPLPGWSEDEAVLQAIRIIADTAAVATERAQLFDAVMRAKVEWETTFDAVAVPLLLRDRNNAILRLNKAAAAYLGVAMERPNTAETPAVCHGCDNAAACVVRQCWLTGQQARAELTDAATGKIYAVRAFPIPSSHDRMEAVLEYVEDITAAKEESERMLQVERLRALGEVASGVAHDFNNVLTGILGYAELLTGETTISDRGEMLRFIRQSALDAADIVRRMQTFYRAQTDFPVEPINLNQLLQDVLGITRPRWKDAAEASGLPVAVHTEYGEIGLVSGKASEIREVFTNLIFNALDAMPQGGTLSIRTRNEGRQVVITVADTGSGMTDEVQARIFESFFTTKGKNGTGLGLSLAYSIISTHGGEIVVDSMLGEGSTFTVRLPRADVDDAAPQPERAAAAPVALDILVVDDDPRVRAAITALLQRDGHTVSTAAGGPEALELLSHTDLDLIITDLGMPEMNGHELVRRVKLAAPEMQIVMMTGWSDQLADDDWQSRGIDAVIGKPIRIEELRAVIEEVAVRRNASVR